MGYSKKRTDRHGKPRYTACYLDVRGSLRSAGTFTNKKDSDKAWHRQAVPVIVVSQAMVWVTAGQRRRDHVEVQAVLAYEAGRREPIGQRADDPEHLDHRA